MLSNFSETRWKMVSNFKPCNVDFQGVFSGEDFSLLAPEETTFGADEDNFLIDEEDLQQELEWLNAANSYQEWIMLSGRL